jgi:hypothetical protein
MVFVEPIKAREYLISRVGDLSWTTDDVAIIAESIWPRRSSAARKALRSRLAERRSAGNDVNRTISAFLLFSKPDDLEFIRSRLPWVDPSMRRRLEFSALSKHGQTAPVVQALASKEPADYVPAADALIGWGHIELVCRYLKTESEPKRANAIAGRFTTFRRGDYFTSLPNDVIDAIQRSPQAWECLPPSVKPSPFNAPRDTSKDPATLWSRPPLGGDAR